MCIRLQDGRQGLRAILDYSFHVYRFLRFDRSSHRLFQSSQQPLPFGTPPSVSWPLPWFGLRRRLPLSAFLRSPPRFVRDETMKSPLRKGQDMKQAIEKILASQSRLDDFNQANDFHLRVENSPYMPLSIERHGSTVTVTHYYEVNGDLVPDPDMEFLVMPDGEWLPLAIQHSTGHYFRAVEFVDGQQLVRPEMLRDLRSFARQWGRNLITQGFAR
jgi:hypothetical protein